MMRSDLGWTRFWFSGLPRNETESTQAVAQHAGSGRHGHVVAAESLGVPEEANRRR